MPQIPNKTRAVYLETFGCQMNVLDSELVNTQLRALGYRFTDDHHAADVVLYNTCSVREQAENKVFSRIGLMAQRKKTKPHVVLGVLGCMAERQGADMLRKYPQVDFIVGPAELDKVPHLIDNAVKTTASQRPNIDDRAALQGNTTRRSATLAAAADQLELLDLARSLSPDDHHGSAYVRITRGCNKFCAFCVVPNTRGPEVHRPPDHIVDECKKLSDAGVVEITLLGQTVNHYHYDHGAAITINGLQQPQIGAAVGPTGPKLTTTPGRRVTTFANLLARIHDQVPALKRLRFVTSFPRDFGDDILRTMRDHPRICRYLHLPVQSGSNRILKLMNRGYTIEPYEQLLARARHYLPDVQIASDIITGFPTETDEDHNATRDLLARAAFKNCFIFKYSPRPGTAAITKLPDDVPEAVKRDRNNDLLNVQSQASAKVHQALVGQTLPVFVESISQKSQAPVPTPRNTAGNGEEGTGGRAVGAVGGSRGGVVELGWEKPPIQASQLTARTDGDLIVILNGDPSLIGQIVPVKIRSATALTLFAEPLDQPASTTAG